MAEFAEVCKQWRKMCEKVNNIGFSNPCEMACPLGSRTLCDKIEVTIQSQRKI